MSVTDDWRPQKIIAPERYVPGGGAQLPRLICCLHRYLVLLLAMMAALAREHNVTIIADPALVTELLFIYF